MSMNILSQRSITLLLLMMLLILAPHFLTLPWWESALVIIIGIWRWQASRLGWRLPGALLRVLLIALVISAIVAQYGSIAGRDAGIALLVAMLALKLIELRQRRDLLVILFMAYFVLITHFLYHQTIFVALYVFTMSWGLIALHIHLTHHHSAHLKSSLKISTQLFGQALPLMLVLFILFPRLPGPIWSLPKDAYSGMTGLSDSMSPGNISSLSQSDAIAFRVSFKDTVPPPQQRYWRGPVLTLTDGRNWGPIPTTYINSVEAQWHGNPINYTLTLEPHNKKWLLALDLPANGNEHGQISTEYQFIAANNITQRVRYEMASYPEYNTGDISPVLHHLSLQLPTSVNPQTVALGRTLRRDYHNDEAIIQQTLSIYRNQPFIYTLEPPLLLSKDSTDEFLFQSRRGFCEHYASSFVMIMRAANIPARVVTGYQGGELNEIGNYFVIRQRDAHAWAEVWLSGRGWVRVDPTAAVAPERIERGIDISASRNSGTVLFTMAHNQNIVNLLQQLKKNIDAINNNWNQWILGYGPEQQERFLHKLGLDIKSWKQLAWAMAIAVGGLFTVIALLILAKRQPTIDPVQQQYLIFCHKLSRRGLIRAPHENASAFAQRTINTCPDLAAPTLLITQLYSQLRYGPTSTPQLLLQLREEVAHFKP